jgi:hypothetical protein
VIVEERRRKKIAVRRASIVGASQGEQPAEKPAYDVGTVFPRVEVRGLRSPGFVQRTLVGRQISSDSDPGINCEYAALQ